MNRAHNWEEPSTASLSDTYSVLNCFMTCGPEHLATELQGLFTNMEFNALFKECVGKGIQHEIITNEDFSKVQILCSSLKFLKN